MFAIILIAISLSIDALGIGITYGIRKIRVPLAPKLIISIMSAIITFLSLTAGSQLKKILPAPFANLIGVSILLAMGIYLICQSKKSSPEKNFDAKEKKSSVYQIIIKSLNLTIKIIHEPQLADLNNSKTIELPEAFCIGLALSIDSIGSGIGLSILGFNNFLLPLATAICQYIFFTAGIFSGKKISKITPDNNKFVLISGIILIFIALIRIL